MMQIQKLIKNLVKKVLKSKRPLSEEKYYEQLFVKNQYWNKSSPNEEEVLRWEIIQKFMNYIVSTNDHKELNILDLGCGRGWLTNLLSDYGKILGIEPIKPVVKYAKKLFPSIEFLCGTTKTLLLKQNNYLNKFNLIVTSEVIEHIPDVNKEEFIEDINHLLSFNGYLIITTPRKEAQNEWNSYLTPGQPVEDWMSENELEQLLIKKNFKKIFLERFSIKPTSKAPEIEIYQLWLYKKTA